MDTNQFSYDWLEDPQIFRVGQLDPFSDHEICQQTAGDLEQTLNGIWKVHVSKNPYCAPAGFYQPGLDTSQWKEVCVPGHLQMEGLVPHQYTNTLYPWDGKEALRPPYISKENNWTACYKKSFVLPDRAENKHVILSFDGVETAMAVWVNGHFAGYGEDSFTPSRFDITSLVHNGENEIAVQVFQRSSASWIEDQDMFRFMGIFRDVTLSFWPQNHVFDIAARQTVDLPNQSAKLEVSVKNWLGSWALLEARLLYKGRTVCLQTQEMGKDNTFQLDISHVKLWSAEEPSLYTLELSVFENGEIREKASCPIGFRKVEVDGPILKINGRPLVFRGVNRHEFCSKKGRALDRDVMEFDARYMKQNNINAVRTSHYPNHSHWYRLCDEMGLYLIDETNMESHGSWQKLGKADPEWNVPGSLSQWEKAVLDRARNMYERDKNHPSVVMWSLGNESYAGENIRKMHRYFKKADPSRPVHYEGVFWNREFDDASDVESRMYAKPWEIEDYLKSNPAKPFVSCEFAHAMGNSLGNMDEYMALEAYDSYAGGFIWDYVDQAVEVMENGVPALKYGGDFHDYPNDGNFCGNGILRADRSLTPKAQALKQLYTYAKIQVEQPGIRIYNGYTFSSMENLELRWEQKVDGQLIASGTLDLNQAPQSWQCYPVAWKQSEQPGLHTRTARICLKSGTSWAKAGHELGFGQSHFYIAKPAQAPRALTLVQGDGNASVQADGFMAFFEYNKGLVSLQIQGQELLKEPVRPDFFRAFTDNDHGAATELQAGIWMSAGLFARIQGHEIQQTPEGVQVSFLYAVPFVKEQARLTYTIRPSLDIEVDLHMERTSMEWLLPAFGVRFMLLKEFDRFAFAGPGPLDTYADRPYGKYGYHTSTVQEQYVDYLNPQEHGNHYDTSYCLLENARGAGMEAECLESSLEISASCFTPEALQIASHPEELPSSNGVCLRILSQQMGIGGDDSWGAPVHEAYLLKDKALNCRFLIRLKGEDSSAAV